MRLRDGARHAAAAALLRAMGGCYSAGHAAPPERPPAAVGALPDAGGASQEAKVKDDAALQHYRAHLERTGRPTDGIWENEAFRGAYRYFARESGRTMKIDEAAVDAAGAVVSDKERGHWHAFLSQKGLDAAGLAERALWLTSHTGQLLTSGHDVDAAAKSLVSAPALEHNKGTVHLTFWAAYPPEVTVPFRVRFTAPASGPATFESTRWDQVHKAAPAGPKKP